MTPCCHHRRFTYFFLFINVIFQSPPETIVHQYLQSWASLLPQGVLTHGSAGCLPALKSYILTGQFFTPTRECKTQADRFCRWKTELWEIETSCLRISSWSGTEVDVRSQAFQDQVSVFCSKMELTSGEPAVLIPLLGTLQHSPSHPTPILEPHRMERDLRPASFSQSLLQ